MSVLAQIVDRKRVDVAARHRNRSWDDLRRGTQPSDRCLIDALRSPGPRFILESKHRSPSGGILRPHYDPAAIADVYRDWADAISVLTDEPYFGGSLEHLRIVRDRVSVPVLCKDFVVDPYQVTEARHFGADAILLMLSVLDDAGYQACAAEAERLAMDVLTEVHDERELQRANRLGARIIGINNRDLRTLKVDLDTTSRLASLIPADRVRVCESGLFSRADWTSLCDCVDGFLIGTSLMQSPRLDLAVRALILGRTKICGLTHSDHAAWAYDAGAIWGGLIFADQSPRCVTIDQARAIAEETPLPLVGVFVEHSADQIARIADELGLAAVQLHGDQDAAMIAKLRHSLPQACQIWKVVRVDDKLPHIELDGADRILLDRRDAKARGGTGKSFDWRLLGEHPDRAEWILSGGIAPENVAEARQVGCWALDVNSGVEHAPGIKDQTKIQQLFAHLRGAP